MNNIRTSFVMAAFLLLILTVACKNQSDRQASGALEIPEKTSTPAPLLAADPVSEEKLRQAAYEGNRDGVKALLEQAVNVNAVDIEGRTALVFAAFNGHSEILIDLLESGAVLSGRDAMGRTALMYGSTGPFPEAVKILLDKGADPNLVDSDEHFTALMHAAAEGHLEVVKVLMEYGADQSLKDIDGDNAESFAQQSGHTPVVNYLQSLQ